jgi:hypothetical protein
MKALRVITALPEDHPKKWKDLKPILDETMGKSEVYHIKRNKRLLKFLINYVPK